MAHSVPQTLVPPSRDGGGHLAAVAPAVLGVPFVLSATGNGLVRSDAIDLVGSVLTEIPVPATFVTGLYRVAQPRFFQRRAVPALVGFSAADALKSGTEGLMALGFFRQTADTAPLSPPASTPATGS